MADLMVVEDEMFIGLALAGVLEGDGHRVLGPYTAAGDAMRALDDATPDAAFLDINLGNGETSFGIAERLAELGVPFVFLTGYSEFRGVRSRFVDVQFLSKPVTNGKVREVVAELTGGD